MISKIHRRFDFIFSLAIAFRDRARFMPRLRAQQPSAGPNDLRIIANGQRLEPASSHLKSESVFRQERDSNAQPFRLNGTEDEDKGKSGRSEARSTPRGLFRESDLAETVLADLVVDAPGCDTE